MWPWCRAGVGLVGGVLAGAIGKVWRRYAVWLCPHGQRLGRQNWFSRSDKNVSFVGNGFQDGSQVASQVLGTRCL